MVNKKIVSKQIEKNKRLDIDLWIIWMTTFIFFGIYTVYRIPLITYIKNVNINIMLRLLLNASLQFGVAGLGIVIALLFRKENVFMYGFKKKNTLKSIIGTILSFTPLIIFIFLSGSFKGYKPFSSIIIFNDVISSRFPINLISMLIIVLTWGFFEGINYVVISDKINQRYPSKNILINYGAIFCAIVCLLFHPIDMSFFGIIELITTFIAIYGMLIVKTKTGNAWGSIFAFCLIWNAI